MSDQKPRPRLLLDTGALALGEHMVLDIDYQTVQMFAMLEEADAFIADANGCGAETVRHETEDRARMLAEYRENLTRASRERWERESKPDAPTDGGGQAG